MRTIYQDGDYSIVLLDEEGSAEIRNGTRSRRFILSRPRTLLPFYFPIIRAAGGNPKNYILCGGEPIRIGARKAIENEVRKIEERRAAEAKSRTERLERMFPGLSEIRKALLDEEERDDEVRRRLEDESLSSFLPGPVSPSSCELKRKYPLAAAYLRLEAESRSSNDIKWSIYNRGLKEAEDGGDVLEILKRCNDEWSAAVRRWSD